MTLSGVRTSKPLLAIILSSLLVLSIIPLVHMASGQASTLDFGDAPDGGATGYPAPFAQTGSFPTLLASDGARVQSTSDATLGPTGSLEANALVVNGDSDDGLSELIILTVSIPPPAKLSVTVNGQPGGSGGTFFVNVLIDLNLDGEWSGATVNGQPEWVVQNFPTIVTPGQSNVVPLPEFGFSNGNALPSGAWMRIALTKEQITASGWDGSGEFSSGEIEDHVILLPLVGGKTPAMPVIENCQPNPALFPPGGIITMFTCDIFSPQPGFATVTFNCVPDTVAIISFGNIGPPFPVGPAKVALNFIAFKGASPPPRVNCIVTASSQDPPSKVTPTGVTVGFADSTTTAAFDTTDEDAIAQTYAAISETMFAHGGNDILWNSFYADLPITIRNEIVNTTPDPLNMTYIVQVLNEDGVTVHISSQELWLPTEGESLKPVTEWMPSQLGTYTVRIYGWDSLDTPTRALSYGKSSQISLTDQPPTRPAEWWAEHPGLVEQVWSSVIEKDMHPQCGDDYSVDSVEKVMGAFWFEPEEGQSLSDAEEARMALAREIIAARLNNEAFAGILTTEEVAFQFDKWDAILCDYQGHPTQVSLEILSEAQGYNERGNAKIDPIQAYNLHYFSVQPDAQLAQELADRSIWYPTVTEETPEEEEEPETSPQPDSSEITFAHKVGDTDCPQFIGSIFLEDTGVDGEWTTLYQPEWLDVEVAGNFVEFYFNCFIEDPSSQTIDDEVVFEFFADDPEFDEDIDRIEITVIGEIIGIEED